MIVMSTSVEETLALGRRLGRLAAPGQCLALSGPLGAGKTHLVRGLAAGAQVLDPDLASSPTFVLLNIYAEDPANPDSKAVFHLDAYRAHGPADFEAVGFDELLHERAIIAVEWPERIPGILPADHLLITIDPQDESTREFTLQASGPRSQALLTALRV